MIAPPDERTSRLPRWARNRIEKLEADLARATRAEDERVIEALGGGPSSDTFVCTDRYHDETLGLGNGPEIRFRLGDDEIDTRIEDHGGILVLCLRSRHSALHVQPEVSNVLLIRPERWW